MPARALVACAAVLGAATTAAAALAAASPSGFSDGVAAGEMTPTSAKLWTRAPRAGKVMLTVTGAGATRTFVLTARRASDLTVQRSVSGLRPGASYRYSFAQGAARSRVGRFETAPAPGAAARVRFAVSGDADATPGPNGKPGFNGFETYGAMARARNDFAVNLGDTIYSDSGVGGTPVARTVAQKWAKYRLGLGLEPLRRLRSSTGLYSGWDDHEFVNDFSRAEHGAAIYRAGVKAFLDYTPASYSGRTGGYRTFRWGKNLELFLLDGRSFRSAKATAACGGDIAPTAPAAVRQAFAALAPALAQPVPQACLDALASPQRTLLGAAQLAAFTKAIRASTATFKVVLNPEPLLQLYALPYDRWEGYAAERARVLDVLRSVRNVVVLTTDMHAHVIGEIRTDTFAPGGPVGTGIWEVVTGPVATNTYAKEIDSFLGAPGSGAVVTGAFLRPAPPRGLGLRCAQTDAYGYAQVTVTPTTLTVQPRTATGRAVLDATGVPCAPLVLRAT
ncbi:MAG: alkaline phosphatase D family protein [Gaiella sp.]|nr:alkaline phosphatase D family protein [Gaiella sp.]